MSAMRRGGQGLTLAGLVTASLAFALMQTLLIPALPVLQRELGATPQWTTWTVTAYLLTGSVASPIIGRLGDQHGKVRMMVFSLAVFLLGSIGAALAPNVGVLVAFRAVQGVGGAVFPLSYAIVRDEFPPEKMAVALGIVSATLGVGGGIGIVAAGLIVDNASWRWLFVLSAAIGLLALILVAKFIPESPVRTPSRVDWWGAILLSAGLVSLLVGLTQGQPWGWGSPGVVGLIAASVVILVIWAWVESRTRQPMVDVRLMARRPVFFTNLTALLSGLALYMTWVLIPTLYQLPDYGFGTSTTVAGLWILPTSVAIIVFGPVAGIVGRSIGARPVLAAGMLLLAMGCGGIAMWHDTPLQTAASFTLVGVGIAFAFASMPRLIVESVPVTETGVATGMNNVIRTVGGVIGAQVAAVLLASHTTAPSPIPAEAAFTDAFMLSVVAGLLGVVAAILIGRPHPQIETVTAGAARPARGRPD